MICWTKKWPTPTVMTLDQALFQARVWTQPVTLDQTLLQVRARTQSVLLDLTLFQDRVWTKSVDWSLNWTWAPESRFHSGTNSSSSSSSRCISILGLRYEFESNSGSDFGSGIADSGSNLCSGITSSGSNFVLPKLASVFPEGSDIQNSLIQQLFFFLNLCASSLQAIISIITWFSSSLSIISDKGEVGGWIACEQVELQARSICRRWGLGCSED